MHTVKSIRERTLLTMSQWAAIVEFCQSHFNDILQLIQTGLDENMIEERILLTHVTSEERKLALQVEYPEPAKNELVVAVFPRPVLMMENTFMPETLKIEDIILFLSNQVSIITD